MAHANAIFLSLLSGASLVLAVAPGCSNNGNLTAEVALTWGVTTGSNDPSVCPVGGGDNFQIGNPEGSTIVTAPNGGTYLGVPVTVNCDVAQNGGSYTVNANVQYGNEGSLSINGTIVSAAGLPPTWPTQQNIKGSFNDHLGLIENMSENDCTISFAANPNMGIAPTRIWGTITCPQAAAEDGKTCQGVAEFLFENCQQ